MEAILQFLDGGITVTFFAVGFFFLRYWHQGKDRFYLFFMAAFWAFAASWGVHLLYATPSETGTIVYALRVVGFVLITLAIVDKNRRARLE